MPMENAVSSAQTKRLDDPTIATLTTAEIYQGRLLCTNEFVCEPVRCVIEVAGNNLELSDELRGRAVLMRFDAEMENPGERDTSAFKHPNLKEWVKNNRADLVWAVLTIIQAWIAKGKQSAFYPAHPAHLHVSPYPQILRGWNLSFYELNELGRTAGIY